MEITPEHRAQASRIVNQGPSDTFPPAYSSFLSAVERIDDSTFLSASRTDQEGDALEVSVWGAGTGNPSVHLDASLKGGEEGEEDEGALLIFPPDEAEALGWELVALAHLARMGR